MAKEKQVYSQKQNRADERLSVSGQYAYILVPLFLLLVDYSAVVCAEELSYALRNLLVPTGGRLVISHFTFFVSTPVLYILFMNASELYTRKMQFWRIIERIFRANAYAIVSVVVLLYITHIAGTTSRLYVGLLGIFGFIFIVLFRFILNKLLNKLHMLEEPVLLIGAGLTASIILKHMKGDSGLNYRFIGYLEDYEPNPEVAAQIPRLGGFADAASVIKRTGVKNIMVMAPGLKQEQIQDIIYNLQPLVANISFVPDMGTVPLSNLSFESLVDGHMVMFRTLNNLKNRGSRLLKFVFDWTLTLVGTILISPVLMAIGIWIYRDSPGPFIFKHRRIGKDGKEFNCYKFRSMCVDADVKLKELLEKDPEARAEWEKDFKLKNDPRITKSGAFLRKTSLDELPQIFNVLKGEMSLVGPRPIIRDEIPRYGKYIEDYYMVRPGITGMWQTSGRSDIDYDERVQMDTWYVRNWSIWFDIVLLWRTFSVVLNKKGAY